MSVSNAVHARRISIHRLHRVKIMRILLIIIQATFGYFGKKKSSVGFCFKAGDLHLSWLLDAGQSTRKCGFISECSSGNTFQWIFLFKMSITPDSNVHKYRPQNIYKTDIKMSRCITEWKISLWIRFKLLPHLVKLMHMYVDFKWFEWRVILANVMHCEIPVMIWLAALFSTN